MVMECFPSISNIVHTLLGSSGTPTASVPSIPDDILFDILSRLPADCVQECRKVCRHWRTLTSSCSFAELQLRRATSVIYVHCHHFLRLMRPTPSHLFVFDGKKKGRKRINLKPVSIPSIRLPLCLCSSFGGLFLLRSYCACIVCDARGESISINYPTSRGTLCGLYFLPLASDYKILYQCNKDYYYYIYESTTRVWRSLESRYFVPYSSPPAFVNMAMHWIVYSDYVSDRNINLCEWAVMGFQMDTETFFHMPHPGKKCTQSTVLYGHLKVGLFVKGGLLCLWDIRFVNDQENGGIDIWVLEDYASRLWVKRHRISPGMFRMPYPVSLFTDVFWISIAAVNEDEVLLYCSFKGLYLVNLTQGTIQEFKDLCHTDREHRRYVLTSHTNCLHPSVF